MPVRHNTGGEFPPGSGKKWLGVQFNNNDVLVNVYGGKYEDQSGKKRTQRFYGGRFKTMGPALESVIKTLQKKIQSGKYSAYEAKWGLKEKLERAKIQIRSYGQEVTQKQEQEGLRRLNITSRKRKTKSSRLQSSHPKKQHEVKKEYYINTNSNGTLSSATPSGMYVVHKKGEQTPPSVRTTTTTTTTTHTQTSSSSYVTPANMFPLVMGGVLELVEEDNEDSIVFDDDEHEEEIKFPMLPPQSPQYWADADGGASEASMSRSCSPFFTPTPPPTDTLYRDSALGSMLPPKIVDTDELLPAVRPLYDDAEDPFDSPLESESSDVTMEDDFMASLSELRRSCFTCRVSGGTCLSCQAKNNESGSPFGSRVNNGYSFPSIDFFERKTFKDFETEEKFPPFDFLKNDDEDEEMMDIEVKHENPWTSDFLTF